MSCEHCNKIDKDGKVRYAHTVVLPVIVKPGGNEVLSLEPEFVLCEDGANKQDCEGVAAKLRLSYKLRGCKKDCVNGQIPYRPKGDDHEHKDEQTERRESTKI